MLYKKGYSLKPLNEKDIEVDELINRFKQMEEEEIRKKAEMIKSIIDKENGTQRALEYIEKVVREWRY